MAAASLTTQDDVFRLKVPAGKAEALFFDEGKPKVRAPGLALRIREGGSKKFVFFYRLAGKQWKITIGDAESWKLDDARKEARDMRVQLDKGENPATAKKAKRAETALTFSSVVEEYLKARARDMRPRSLVECTRHLRVMWKPLHGLALGAVTRQVVASHLRKLVETSGAVSANRARATLSAMYAWAIGEGLVDENPVSGTNKSTEKSRDRVLSDAELVKIWLACAESGFGRIVKLLMLTAQRRDEIRALRWSEIDKDEKVIRLEGVRTKNGRPHDVPLSSPALSVLDAQPRIVGREWIFGEGEGGFSGFSAAKKALDEKCGVSDWTLHDLRRTAATRMADLEVPPHVIEAALNHVSGHKHGVAGIYNRSTYSKEKRAALDLWANHLLIEVAKAAGANVVSLKTGRA